MDPLSLAGLGIGLIGGIGKLFGRGNANKEMEALMMSDPARSIDPEAEKRLAMAKTMLNARMPGAAAAQNAIYGNQANRNANIQRNATDASQVLALGAAAQGDTNDAINNLSVNEAQDYQRRYGNYVNASDAMIREGDKVFEDKVRRFNDKVQFKGAQNQNRQSNWQSISNLGFGLSDFGMSGGMNSLFGGNGGGGFNPDDIANMPRMPYNPTKLPY